MGDKFKAILPKKNQEINKKNSSDVDLKYYQNTFALKNIFLKERNRKHFVLWNALQ